MNIQLRPDADLPDDQLFVADDLDGELMEALWSSPFDVRVDEGAPSGSIRVSLQLAERLDEWMTLCRLRGI